MTGKELLDILNELTPDELEKEIHVDVPSKGVRFIKELEVLSFGVLIELKATDLD